LYGTIQKPPEHQPDGVKNVQKGDVKATPRNIQTSPTKKGGSGYYHTLIGGREFEWQNEPMGGVKKKIVGQIEHKPISKPFYSTIHGDRQFDSKVYTEDGVKPRSKSVPKDTRKITIPFKSMTHEGETINKFPEYMNSDVKLTPEERRARIKHEKVWRPSGTDDLSVPTRSVFFSR
jgi:hypothetical protein